MTRIPTTLPHRSSHLLLAPRLLASIPNMAAPIPTTIVYPKPLSPPHPSLSKEVELTRAMSASARSSTYTLPPNNIVFEDDWLVVANKPSGIYCESLLSSPNLNGAQSELHLANRLDRDTSGLMVITKSHKAAAKLVKAFTDHKIKKTYIALCTGAAPDWGRIRISSGHGRSRFGAWRVYSAADIGRSLPGGSLVKDMATAFEVLSSEYVPPGEFDMDGIESVIVEDEGDERSKSDGEEEEVLIRAYPESGRTHQIRLHCQHLGVPIRGDVKYGGVYQSKGVTWEGHCLHAESLAFEHPITGLPVKFRAPLPVWASEFCRNSDFPFDG